MDCRSSHSCFVWGEQMWLFDGCPDAAASSAGGGLADLYRYEFLSQSWTAVDQNGCLPDRRLNTTCFQGFHRTVTYGPYLLAFGCEQGDENQPPSPDDVAASPYSHDHRGASKRKQLMLHAYDFCSNTW